MVADLCNIYTKFERGYEETGLKFVIDFAFCSEKISYLMSGYIFSSSLLLGSQSYLGVAGGAPLVAGNSTYVGVHIHNAHIPHT